MEKKKRKSPSAKIQIPNVSPTFFSKEEYIDAHAEAYYRAMKRMNAEDTPIPSTKKTSGFGGLRLFFCLIFCPQKVLSLSSARMADNLLNMIVSGILSIFGVCLRICGLIVFLSTLSIVCRLFTTSALGLNGLLTMLILIVISILLAMFGSIFKLAALELEKESNPNKLYAYSSGIMATLAFIVSAVGVYIQLFG